MKKTLVIYHGNCPDGFGAALAAWHKFGDAADYQEAHYGQAPPDVAGREVVIVDFSYPRATLEAMHAAADSLMVIDHHKTAQADLAGLNYAYFDMDHSGAVLAWKTLHDDGCVTVPRLLQHIEDRDLWRFAMPGTQEISLALWTKPRTFEEWSRYLHDVSELAREGAAMLGYQNRLVEQMSANARWRAVGPHIVPVVNASCCFSDVGDALCRKFPAAKFVAYWFDRGDGFRQWGLRSRGGFDVSNVAKRFGGGGHAAAAGWSEKNDGRWKPDVYEYGADVCRQDSMENAPFASIGGRENRSAPVLPDYVMVNSIDYQDAWLRGYIDEAARMYGEDWRTCEFGWKPAAVIGKGGANG